MEAACRQVAEVISSSAAIDVYVFCDDGGAPGDQGRLVVWTA
jgi:hypothetical protein